jgi:hypothetical protein
MTRRKAQTFGSAIPGGTAAGASRRVSRCVCSASGRAFSAGLRLPASVSQLLAGTRSGPERSPDAAGCLSCVAKPAGAAPRPAS